MSKDEAPIRSFPREAWRPAVLDLPEAHADAFRDIEHYQPESRYYWYLLLADESETGGRPIAGGFSFTHPEHGHLNVDLDAQGRAVGIEFYERLLDEIEEDD